MTPKPKRIGRPPRGFEAERTVVYLPTKLKVQLEHRAVDERSSLTELVTRAVTAYLRGKPASR